MSLLSAAGCIKILKASGIDTFPDGPYKKVPFYSEAYKLTYGEQEANAQPYIDLLTGWGMTRGQRVLELFSGEAVESALIQEEFPENLYYAADIEEHTGFKKFPNIKYLKEDCLAVQEPNLYDVVFVGGINASLCTALYKYADWLNFIKYLDARVGKYVVLSFFDVTNWGGSDVSIHVEKVSKKVEYFEKYKDYRVDWYNIIHAFQKESLHVYYDFCCLYDKKGRFVRTDFMIMQAKSWPLFLVINLMKDAGYELSGDKYSLNPSYLAFVRK